MAVAIVLCGTPEDTGAAARAIATHVPEVRLGEIAHPWELAQKVRESTPDVVVLLRGPITEHDERVRAVAVLRRDGFGGKILYSGAFLSERQDALAAGADIVFDAARQPVDAVVAAALHRPLVAADHPYLRHLCVGEWAQVVVYADALPGEVVDVLLAATSCHKDAAFWLALADYARSHRESTCVVVEDDDDKEVHAEALSSGVQPYVALGQVGLLELHRMVRRLLREAWLARVAHT